VIPLPQSIGPLPGGAEAWWILHHAAGRWLVLTPTEEAAGALFDDFQALERWQAPSASTRAAFFSEDDDERLTALSLWARGEVQILFAPRESVETPLSPLNDFSAGHRTLRLGHRLNREDFFAHLLAQGYERVDTVERPGEVAVRGEVLDLWSPGWEGPLRTLWPFDQIESIRKIDLTTQRSTDLVTETEVRPGRLGGKEVPLQSSTLLDYLGPEGTLFESHPSPHTPVTWTGARIAHDPLARNPQLSARTETEKAGFFTNKKVQVVAGTTDKLFCEGKRPDFSVESRDSTEDFGLAHFPDPLPYTTPPPVVGHMDLLAKEVVTWVKTGWKISIFCHNPGEQERVEEILLEQDRSLAKAFEDKTIDLPIGPLTHGFLDTQNRLAVLANGELFGRVRRRLRLPKFTGGTPLGAVAELRKGDYVVHEQFGIGRYMALERKSAGNMEADYLRLEYRNGDRVFVPLFDFRLVRKFVGTEGKRPVLSSLDTGAWDRTRADVEKAVAELAKELLARAARRSQTQGLSFPEDTHMEKEFGTSFLYELTPDQARAIEETRQDMMRPIPMDRVVCGDVGYGKTEVAMRAAFKAVTAGKQVAVLVPTTILAEQHGRNFRDRFADYPVRVAVLSRFGKPADQKVAIQDVRRGVIDIVIGTHRLLSPDVAFKDLGLVIIDEEHRFGVKQKERIRAFRDVVDVLALSATPIPRTMGQALGGLRGLSVIETPPEGRLPIGTHVGPFDRKVVVAAVEQELRRGGQVFYVHNRVKSIEKRRQWLTDTLKDHGLTANIALAHGQMSGPELEKIMWDFLHRKHDILLATSIIESGLDIPTVNTLVVEEAEDFGLAQLYQLRGRVGRERVKAYCLLFYSDDAHLTEEAEKRLSALKEFASLGSGFKLAMRDLEIRGAGNLLGPEQHGYVNAVGLDLYGQLLTDEIEQQKMGGSSAQEKKDVDPSIEIPISAFLPETYLPSESDRVLFYKRLLDAPLENLEKLAAELEDRCGRMPDPARRLFDVARLRHAARSQRVTHIGLEKEGLELRFSENAELSPETLTRLTALFGNRFSFLPGPPFGMRFEEPLPTDLVEWTTTFLSTLDSGSEEG
jgi:transcription-repair coupling factor (superfamily II helicase)